MANELNLSLAISGSKAGITSATLGRGLQSVQANMVNNLIQEDMVLVNHLGNGTITGATNAYPIVITTSVAHGLMTGESVAIASVGGNTNANGTWTITVLSTTTFSIPTVGNATYTSGGTWRTDPILIATKVVQPHYAWFYNLDTTNYVKILSGNGNIGSISGASNANPIVITTPISHGLSTGTTVVIAGVLGNTAANGTFSITQLTTTTFSIPIAGSGAYTSGGYWFAEPVTTIAKLQAGEPCVVPVDDLVTLYAAAPVAAVQLEYLVYSL